MGNFQRYRIALRNMFLQILLSFLFSFFFYPSGGFLSPLALFFTSAYFYGFSFVDYVMERKRYNVRQSVHYVNKNMGLVTGIGTVFAITLMISLVKHYCLLFCISLISHCCYSSIGQTGKTGCSETRMVKS